MNKQQTEHPANADY